MPAQTISYVQGNYATPQTPQAVVSVAFNGTQVAGDLNVVVVGWNDSTATVSGVTDKAGNVYTRAVGPTIVSGILSQSIYYAKNVAAAAAGANTVTVRFSTPAAYPDVRVLEYSGVDRSNPVDVTAALSGNGTTSSSGTVATTYAPDLLFGANTVRTMTTGPGSGFVIRMQTVPDGDLAEDRMVDAVGSYSTTAMLTSGDWIMQTVAFRTSAPGMAAQPPPPPGNLTATASGSQINLSWSASTDKAGVTGYRVERCQGLGCTIFAQIAAPATRTYDDVGLAPGTYSYRVRAADALGNLSSYSNVATANAASPSTGVNISYVQANYATPQTPGVMVSVPFNAAQIAGDLNVVVVGWNDSTATVSSVVDKSGNVYTRAVGPTVITGALSQSIYYAKNIVTAAAGKNTVTVTFSTAAAYPDIRIVEYSGADLNNPVDVAAGASGSGTSSTVSVTTTNATDLLFAANMVLTSTTGPGTGFTTRLLTSPDGDIAEDRMVTSAGVYNAAATISSGQWLMQVVAFRTSSGGGVASLVNLSSTSLNFGNQNTGGPSSPQTVTLTNIGSAQLTLGSIAVSSGNAGDFAQTNNCGAALAPNASCIINVTFSPTTTGLRSSAVLITDSAPGSPQSITISGTGTNLSVTPRVTGLTFTRTQQFTASSPSVTWSVDGTEGGSAVSGTITTEGLYTPPAAVGTHKVTATLSGQAASATVYVTNYPGTYTYHNDNLRTGQNLNETVLSPANVNRSQFGKLFSYPLDGIAFASPLYVANVSIPGNGFHNVVYVATEHDSVFAFDADGLTSKPLWQVSFLGPGVKTVPCADTGECGDIPAEIGITSTPVIDQTNGTIFVVAKTKEGGRYMQRLHALDIATGAEKFGGPVVLQASVAGTGEGVSRGQVAFDALRENQRAGLLLANGVVYIAFAAHGDQHPWHGWVLGYAATTLQQTMVLNISPDGYGGGIWQSGGGLASDSSGYIFFSTGNGDFTANAGGRDYGDTVVKMSPRGSIADYFTPHDQALMESLDLDLSSAGPVLLVDQPGPNPHLLISAGKSGTIYVINRDNMGQFQTNNDNQIIQSLPGVLPHGDLEQGNFSAPVFFNNYVYFGAVNDNLKAFQFVGGLLSGAPASQSSATYPNRGGSFAISANGAANGILWAVQDNSPGIGVLHAYDAGNLANELYNSSQAGSRDALDVASKFNIPLVVNGKVFVVSNGQLTAFGLLP